MYDYKAFKEKGLEELEELRNYPDIQAAITQTLHNKSGETDYAAWIEGAKKAATDNYDVLKEWIN
ncbi:MAG: hypothetical protein FWD48_09505 [Oscillospiraceae bacterium]|nr:hypothetical protein [Oscillospiraceae bacterium]